MSSSLKTKPEENVPKRPLTAYTYYSVEQFQIVKKEYPKLAFGEIAKHIDIKWAAMSEKEKTKYKKMEKCDKTRYEAELALYKTSTPVLKKSAVTSKTVKTTTKATKTSKPKEKKVSLSTKLTKTQSIKVSHLRKTYKNKDINLKIWLEDPQNVYTGRPGRIFIDKKIFHYPGSKWANPFKVGTKPGEYTLKKSLELYRQHLIDENLIDDIHELKGKTLGCFCDTATTTGAHSIDCHTKVLLGEISNLKN